MNRKHRGLFWTACAIWIATAGLFGGIWVWGIRHAPLGQRMVPIEMSDVGKIKGQESLGQTFLCSYNGLYQVKVVLSGYGRPNTGPVYFHLKTGPDATESLVDRVIPSEAVTGDALWTLTFDPIPNSAGKAFYFELEAPQATENNAITAYVRTAANYADGTAYRAGQPINGDLIFSLYFQVGGLDRARILLDQMTEKKPALWGNRYFYLFVGMVYVGLLAALALAVMRVLPPETPSTPSLSIPIHGIPLSDQTEDPNFPRNV